MKRFIPWQFVLLTALGVLSAAGCASNPTLGDKIRKQGDLARDLGDDWNKGQKMLDKGNKLVAESEKLAKSSQEKAEEGRQLITDGQHLMSQSEVAFRDQFNVPLPR